MGRATDPSDGPPRGEFEPIRPNPYIVGNPVRGRSMFFGRETEFELVRKRFQDSSHGGLLVFCGERRSGKTSILFQILDRRLGPDFIPVLVDMQSMAITNEADFLGKIAAEIAQALGPDTTGALPDFGSTSNQSAAFQNFVARVKREFPDRKLILLFDEYELFENKIEAGTLSEDALHVLANLMESQSIFMIFTGSQHLEARRHDYWKILGKSIYKRISYLERQDALDLIQKPLKNLVHYAPQTVDDIYRLTAGQPFYTQAVCQNLVDWLNENRSYEVSRETVAEVADGLVQNPLPQMIFLWDSLGRNEKLALALLAETLSDETDFATQKQLERTMSSRGYPLDLDAAQIAPALEKLFKEDELLLKNDATVSGYAFRMDLWRRWIRRMHSVWQVMREEGIEFRRRRSRRPWALLASAVFVAIVALILWGRGAPPAPPPGGGQTPAAVRITVSSRDAVLQLDGAKVGVGEWRGDLAPGRHAVHVSAPGYVDTSFVLYTEPGREYASRIELRRAAQTGRIDVVTDPDGARVVVDGEVRGTSPLALSLVPGDYLVEASLPDRAPVRRNVTVVADSSLRLALSLGPPTASVIITSEPVGAAVSVDGHALGTTPTTMGGIALGQHEVAALLEGWAPFESTVVVTAELRQIHMPLRRNPPGEIEVRGDLAARLYIDGEPIGSAHLYNWKVPLAPGSHQVRVVPSGGEPVETVVEIQAGERLTYEYTKNGIRRAGGQEGRRP